jgi:hypothetical protein
MAEEEYDLAMVDGKPFVLPPRWREREPFRRCALCDEQAAFIVMPDWRQPRFLRLCPRHQTDLDGGREADG